MKASMSLSVISRKHITYSHNLSHTYTVAVLRSLQGVPKFSLARAGRASLRTWTVWNLHDLHGVSPRNTHLAFLTHAPNGPPLPGPALLRLGRDIGCFQHPITTNSAHLTVEMRSLVTKCKLEKVWKSKNVPSQKQLQQSEMPKRISSWKLTSNINPAMSLTNCQQTLRSPKWTTCGPSQTDHGNWTPDLRAMRAYKTRKAKSSRENHRNTNKHLLYLQYPSMFFSPVPLFYMFYPTRTRKHSIPIFSQLQSPPAGRCERWASAPGWAGPSPTCRAPSYGARASVLGR